MAICSSASRSFYTPPRGRATEQAPNIRRVETEQERAVFDVSIATNGPTVNEVAGVSFFLGLDDPDLQGRMTTGGRFSDATHESTSALAGGRTYLFPRVELNVGQSFNFSNELLVFSTSTTVNRPVTQSGSLLGTFEVDFTSATLGAHTMFIGNLDVTNASFTPLSETLRGTPLNYTVVPIPEPASCMLVSGALLLGLQRRANRKRAGRRVAQLSIYSCAHNPTRQRGLPARVGALCHPPSPSAVPVLVSPLERSGFGGSRCAGRLSRTS